MANLLKQGAAWLARTQARHAAEVVTYLRGEASVRVRATVGRSEFEVDDGAGTLTRSQTRDYLVPAGELVLDGAATEPQPGDRIVEGPLDAGQAYEVRPPPGVPAWRWSDDFRTTLRIHTRYVGPYPAEAAD